MAKKEVPFRLVDINTEQFASFEDRFDSSDLDANIDFGLDFKLDKTQNLLGVFTRYEFTQEENVILLMECSCSFHIAEEFWQHQTDGDNIVFPSDLLTHLLVLTVGTARGIIHAKKPKQFQHLLLPTLNVSKIISEDKVFSLTAQDEEE